MHKRMRPSYVFAYEREADASFVALKQQYGSEIAFHGTAFENVYSILHSGFCSHMNKVCLIQVAFSQMKVALFGEGTYLSTDIGVCANFTKASRAWRSSTMGDSLSAVVVCEVVHHPDVKFPSKDVPSKCTTSQVSHSSLFWVNFHFKGCMYVWIILKF